MVRFQPKFVRQKHLRGGVAGGQQVLEQVTRIVPTATRAVEHWNNEKELEYLREQEDEQVRRTHVLNQQLREKNTQLESAYRAVEASHQQLGQKNKRLSELYETAHRFVDNVSHEMRTPLTVIKGYLGMMRGHPTMQEQEPLLQAVDGVMQGTNRLHQIVNSMLDVTRLENQVIKPHMELTPIAPMLRLIQKEYQKDLIQVKQNYVQV